MIDSLVLGATPVYIDVSPLGDEPEDECFLLVQQQVDNHGGEAVVGWSLWEFPNLFVEAEFHCVWRQPDGAFIDITPKRSGIAKVLFIADPARSYEGRQVNNVRRPISQIPELKRYLDSFDSLYEFMNRGDRAEQLGEIHLSGEDAREYGKIMKEQEASFIALVPNLPCIELYHPCPCGSGRKVKWCHRAAADGS